MYVIAVMSEINYPSMASFALCYKLRAAATMCQILWKSRAVAAVVMC